MHITSWFDPPHSGVVNFDGEFYLPSHLVCLRNGKPLFVITKIPGKLLAETSVVVAGVRRPLLRIMDVLVYDQDVPIEVQRDLAVGPRVWAIDVAMRRCDVNPRDVCIVPL